MPKQLTNLRIDEVSSVDRGAGKGVRAVLIKRDSTEVERQAAQATVDKALTLALGALIAKGDGKVEDYVELFNQFHKFLGADAPAQEIDMKPEEIAALVADAVSKALADRGVFEKMTKDHQDYFQHLDGDEAKRFQHMDHSARAKYMKDHPMRGAPGKAPPETGDADSHGDKDAHKALAKIFGDDVAKTMLAAVAKSEPKLEPVHKADVTSDIAKAVEPLQKRVDELTKANAALVEKDQKVEFGKRAVNLGLQESDGEMLRKAHLGDPEALKSMEEMIAKLAKQAATGDFFKEYGSTGGSSGSAHEQLVAKASEYRKAHPGEKLTVEQAYDKVYNDPENKALADQERTERMAKINKQAA